jgi:hypothetical protein
VKDRVRAYQRRLHGAFRRALLLALAPSAALQACSDDTIVGSVGVDAGDATTANDAPGPDQTSPEADAGMPEASRTDAPGSNQDASADATTDANIADAADETTPTDATTGEDDAETGTALPWCADASAGTPWWPDASGNCKYFVDLSCPQYVPLGCLLNATDCLKVCTLNTPLFDCEYAQPACTVSGRFVGEAGQPVAVQCDLCAGAGRRPEGLRRLRRSSATSATVGEYLARAAYLEEASVHAFDRLERELRAHRAPASLGKTARRSAMDEVRHADAMRRLAAQHGGRPESPRVGRSSIRSLERVARENVVEGCVRETYGALLATWQAAHATDAGIRRCFSRIAADETRHAALAWAVAEWAHERLGPNARARLARARLQAIRRIRGEIDRAPSRELAALLGLPSARQARVLLACLGVTWPERASASRTWRRWPRTRIHRARSRRASAGTEG